MTKLYLVTGFLGAGKTSFLHHFAGLFPDKKIALIINEFGKKGVDGALLRDLDIPLTEIDNGSIFCVCKAEQFELAVQQLLREQKPDLIFVEASGLADPSAVRSIFSQAIYQDMEYAGAICLVDGLRFHKVYETAKVCRMQLAISDLVLINKTDLASREQIDGITAIALAQKPGRPVHETTFGAFDPRWLAEMEGPAVDAPPVQVHSKDISLQKLILRVSGFDLGSLSHFLKLFAEDTYRIKGFVFLPEGLHLVDCVGPLVELRPYEGQAENIGELAVLYGHGLPAKKSIREAMEWFPAQNITLE